MVISDGAVFQRDGAIVEVGRYDDLRARQPQEEVIGSSNYVVMPGLVNDHFHVGLTPVQMGAPDLPLEFWGLARIGARDIDPYLDQLYGAVQMIESGTTTVQAIHGGRRGVRPMDPETADKVVKAFQDSGMRVSFAPIAQDKDGLVAGARGGEAEFGAQLPGELAERFMPFLARAYPPVEEIMENLDAICQKYGNNQHERVRVTMAPATSTDARTPSWWPLKRWLPSTVPGFTSTSRRRCTRSCTAFAPGRGLRFSTSRTWDFWGTKWYAGTASG